MTAPPFPRREFPCGGEKPCPWKRSAPPGQFPPGRWEALAVTSDQSLGAPMFGCHKGAPGTDEDLACAGWLAVAGRENIGVRLAVSMGRLPITALEPGEGWPELYASYAELAAANGADIPPDPYGEESP